MSADSNVEYNVESPELNEDLALLNEETQEEEQKQEEVSEESEEEALPESEEPEEETEEEEEEEEKEEKEEKKEEKKAPKAEEQDSSSVHKRLEKKYPGILKEFPEVKQAIFRDQQFSSIIGNPEDAKDMAEHLENLEPIETGLLRGSAAELIKSLSLTNKQTLDAVAADFLPKLFAESRETFYKAVDPVMKNMLNAAFKEGTTRGDKNLQNAARFISKFIYDSFDIPAAESLVKAPSPEQQQLEKDREEFQRQRFQVHQKEVLENSVGQMIKTVNTQVDPKSEMTPLMRDMLSERVMVELDSIITKDTAHMNRMASLWRRATKAGFTPEWKSRIQNTYLLRARQAMPAALEKIRKEAGLKPPKAEQKTSPNQPTRRNITPPSGGPGPARKVSGPIDPKKVDYRATSDMDLLNDRVTFKR